MDRIAISNIAWTKEEDREVAQLLSEISVSAIEVAPGRLFPDPLDVSDDDVRQTRRFWQDHGIGLVAMQSLLFGRADFDIFGDAAMREQVAEYLKRIIDLAGRLGCGPLVFGSPKNRQRGTLPMESAYARAADFFAPLAAMARQHGCTLAIEPNATRYECDFINRVSEAATLVEYVNDAGFGINLDAGVFELEADDVEQLKQHASKIVHFHASQPFLQQLQPGFDTIATLYRVMHAARYRGYVSIEMRKGENGPNVEAIRSSLNYLRQLVTATHT